MLADALRLPWRFLRGHLVRLVLTVVALALGVALVAAMDLVNRAVLYAFDEVIDTMAGRAALQVSGGDGVLFPEDTAAAVARVAGVTLAVPVVSSTAFTTDDSGDVLTVHGFEITNRDAVKLYESGERGLDLEDEVAFLNQADSIAVTRAFAVRHRLEMGSPLPLDTSGGRRTFTVRGILEPSGIAKLAGGNVVLLDLYAAEAMFTKPGFVNRIDVAVARDADLDDVAERIRAVLPAGLLVQAPAQRKSDLGKVMQSLQAMLQGLALVGLVAAFLISFNRLSTVFEERAWQLGILRAVGLNSKLIRRELVKESLVLGLAGVLLGLPLGILFGRLMLPAIANTTAIAFQLSAPEADLGVHPSALVLAAAMGIVAAVLAALLPARRAARQTVIETLRSRGRELGGARRLYARVALVLVAVGIPVSIALQARTRQSGWGLAATALITLATALVARPLITWLSSPRMNVLSRLAGPTGRFARAAVSQHPRRAALTAGMLGVGLGAALWLWMLGGSFERTVLDFLAIVSHADLVVNSVHSIGSRREAPLDGRILDELRAVPGVDTVAAQRAIDWTYGGGPIAITVLDPEYFRDPRYGVHPLFSQSEHARDDIIAGRALWVSDTFARNLGLGVGDVVTLDAPAGRLSLPIAAVTQEFESPRGVLMINRDVYLRYFNDGDITRVHVQVAKGHSVDAVRAEIRRRLGARYALRVVTGLESHEYFAERIRRAFGAIDLLALGVLFVVLVGIADTLAAGVVDRIRVFGTMRAIGATSAHVYRLVIAEGLMLGGLGLALATACGFALGALWVKETFAYIVGWTLQLYLPLRQLGILALVTIAVCVLAALLPARRAARIEVGEALRYE